jgi:formylglycine-generating enzyme required for sulfatase activity
MGKNPSYFTVPDGKTKRHPVEDVSQLDCRDFVAKLREMKPGVKADLPTEAQWEYACRAGSTNRFFFGDDESALGEYAWYDGNSGKTTHPVGQMKPNAWGLYDMYGNVWEWCRDVHNVYLYSEKAFPHLYPKNDGGEYVDPCFSLDALGPRVGAVGIRERGNINVLRGGSWASRAQYTSCACRTREWDEMRRSHVGFRLVIGADVAAKEKEPDKVGAK